MIASLALATVALSLVLAGTAMAAAVRDRLLARWQRTARTVLEVALVAQVVGCALSLARGQRPGEPAVFWAYAATSVLVLPLLGGWVAGDADRWSRPLWPDLLTALACAATAIVVIRMGQTWNVVRG